MLLAEPEAGLETISANHALNMSELILLCTTARNVTMCQNAWALAALRQRVVHSNSH